jgi:hypothetical protein
MQNRRRYSPPKALSASLWVSGAVTRSTDTTEPRVMVSRSRGSSVRGALSLVPFTAYLIVTVGVEQTQVCVPVVLPVSVPVVCFHQVLCREV